MDPLVGTNKNDLFIADNSGVKTNASAADTLDGGKGKDTFKLYADPLTATTAADLPTLKNIENVVIYDNGAGAVDLTKWDSVETLSLVRDANTAAYTLGEKVTTVNLEDLAAAATPTLEFNDAVAAATLGVNKVNAGTTTVDGDALKTLTVDASGKASNVTLDQTTATIETLNITGKADLTLDFATTTTTKLVTIDGSKAEGELALDIGNTTSGTLKTVKTGTGDDTLTLTTANIVATGTTIDLGAGNDELKAGAAGSVAASTTTVIDGGAGIDTLDAALVNAGNAGVFASFETLSLTTAITAVAPATGLDMDLLTKSTITTIAKDNGANAHTLSNVKKSQALTINTNATAATTLTFKASEIAGTADAYTINFGEKAVAAAGTGIVAANTVTINGIETVTVNSTGLATTTKNTITLTDNAAKSLVITGDKAIDVSFATFGTAGLVTDTNGVATIDASAATGAVNINASAGVGVAFNGLAIKGGTAADIITVSADGGTLTGGAGKDTFDVGAAVVPGLTGTAGTVAGGAIKTTITDIEKGDTITFGAAVASSTFTKVTLGTVLDLDAALDFAVGTGAGKAGAVVAAGDKVWFQYGDNTYIVEDNAFGASGAINKIDAGDVIVKLNGLVDLSTATYSSPAAGVDTLIIA